jgi:hypothetical protein
MLFVCNMSSPFCNHQGWMLNWRNFFLLETVLFC